MYTLPIKFNFLMGILFELKEITNMERKIQHTKDNVRRWTDLTLEERSYISCKSRMLIDYLNSHRNKKLSWSLVNDVVSHLYKHFITDYNACHQWTQIIFDNDGIMCKVMAI